jgi:hypothetical protein
MNKKGLLGKILLALLAIILILGVILGIAINKGISAAKTIQTESKAMQDNLISLGEDFQNKRISQGCSKITLIENSFENIRKTTEDSCQNFILRFAMNKFMANQKIPGEIVNGTMSCDNIQTTFNTSYQMMQNQFTQLRTICNNQTLINLLSN